MFTKEILNSTFERLKKLKLLFFHKQIREHPKKFLFRTYWIFVKFSASFYWFCILVSSEFNIFLYFSQIKISYSYFACNFLFFDPSKGIIIFIFVSEVQEYVEIKLKAFESVEKCKKLEDQVRRKDQRLRGQHNELVGLGQLKVTHIILRRGSLSWGRDGGVSSPSPPSFQKLFDEVLV